MDNQNAVRAFVTTFMSTVSMCSLYGQNHPSVEDYTRKGFEILEELLKNDSIFQIMIIDHDLVINKHPFTGGGVHSLNLIKRFKRKGITRVDFLPGLILAEYTQFLFDIAIRERKIKPYPHIKTGIVKVTLKEQGIYDDGFSSDNLEALRAVQLERVKSIYKDVSPFKPLDLSGLEDIIINFFYTLKREANLLKLLSPVRTYSEYTYTHATNVAILSMFLAESIGLEDFIVHEIGIAALLHDVGKLFIPQNILEKKGKLTDIEFSKIMEHPINGADYLLNIDDLTPLAPLAAFEHHIKYNGGGYPRLKRIKRKQHIASQIIAIADFFDALRSHRPYKRSWEVEEIMSLMKENAGKDFNPWLVEYFFQSFFEAIKN